MIPPRVIPVSNKRVCILTHTECVEYIDARVLKEAVSLKQAGYDVLVVAANHSHLPLTQAVQGILIHRTQHCDKSFSFPLALEMIMLSRKSKANIYHAHDLPMLAVAWLARFPSLAPLVYDCHELWVDRKVECKNILTRVFEKALECFLIRCSKATLVVSESIASKLKSRYHIKRPTVLFNSPSYENPGRNDILRTNLNIPADKKILLYAGAVTSNRGIEQTILALKMLPNCAMVILGYDLHNHTSKVKALAATIGVSDRVFFHPAIPHNEVAYYTASADIGTILIQNICLSYYYCMPNKLFECIMAGLPIIASDFPDMKAVIDKYNIGLTVNPISPCNIAKGIGDILDNYSVFSHNTTKAAEVHSWQNQASKLLQIYRQL